ncbi:MAG: ankyrin repeat domain-containing protein [Saprospiraceae bacterium]|nr:ankyrin repeat domain-containing protein [Saprospiraceae bacterium]
MKNLHTFLDFEYGPDGDEILIEALQNGANPNLRYGDFSETLLHVAARRYRTQACEILVRYGADINAKTLGGKTAYAHCIRRGFNDLAEKLAELGADTFLNKADQFAVAVVNGDLNASAKILAANPEVARTGNPEEDRLLADVAGRNDVATVKLLIEVGADLHARALDDGTPLHQTAWFGQPQNARLLIEAGASIDVFESVHGSSPIGWVTHGSRYSGGADERREIYMELAQIFLEAGCSLHYPNEPESDNYYQRLLQDATPGVKEVLKRYYTK